MKLKKLKTTGFGRGWDAQRERAAATAINKLIEYRNRTGDEGLDAVIRFQFEQFFNVGDAETLIFGKPEE